ncbi:MAG: 4-amino-4-deoxychorismate lyase [Acidimicrobiia bacterium]|nr:4-amino-4-deoxychorismate lyase [Acidimicrobiia bacterium]MYC57349.1 4-amino-4-deoxychorismate lyase [Acidimicrobiia bacterium]MYG94552.1 4-amino-4-deoxychorismate lyase [Acidimicrobiia bacterium]MYI30268.1 4-amino-4-deoxychorismate lyase [Acidimicrobiia bacterium]
MTPTNASSETNTVSESSSSTSQIPLEDRIVWLNGVLLPANEVQISPFDHGWLVGDAVFETLVIVRGMPFAISRHLERLTFSAQQMKIALPDTDELRQAMMDVTDANGLNEGRLRVTISSGTGPLGSARGHSEPTAIIAATPQTPWPQSSAVATMSWSINENSPLAGLKTVSYGANVRALSLAAAKGATEAIFPNTKGQLCEGTGSNVFLVHRGQLITPSLASGCLAGVTRQLLIELTGAKEQDIPLPALAAAAEAFLCSTTRNIHPIHTVDNQRLRLCPGPATQAASEAFEQLMATEIDP